MGRFLVLVAIVVLAFWLFRRALARARQGVPPPASAGQGDLVKCAHCGTHLPLAEARTVGERRYCSDEHARLGPRIEPRGG
jgi:uncharacterized protein